MSVTSTVVGRDSRKVWRKINTLSLVDGIAIVVDENRGWLAIDRVECHRLETMRCPSLIIQLHNGCRGGILAVFAVHWVLGFWLMSLVSDDSLGRVVGLRLRSLDGGEAGRVFLSRRGRTRWTRSNASWALLVRR